MAFIILPNQAVVLNAYAALIGQTPGSAALNDHVNYVAAAGKAGYANMLKAYFTNVSNADLATSVLSNLGLTGFSQSAAVAALNSAGDNRIAAILDFAEAVRTYVGPDAAMTAAADKYSDAIEASYNYSSNAANVSGDTLAAITAEKPADLTLTAGTDRLVGTAGVDVFEAFLSQNSAAGGISNTLSSADRLDGGAGADTLDVELVPEFFGTSGSWQVDVQPRTKSIETIKIEARDGGGNDILLKNEVVSVDAKYMTGVNSIGSNFSDGDLVIENLTTLTDAGVARNTDAITVTMDHTDNFNSDTDASDLTVYFDEDYLLAGQSAQSQAFYFLLDEAAELAGKASRLEKIDVDGIRFSLDGGATIIDLQNAAAQTAGTHAGFIAALQADLAALIAAGTVPAGTTLTLDPTRTDVTGLDNGSMSAAIPAMVLTIGNGTKVTPIGFSRVEQSIGQYDVYGQFDDLSVTSANPITVNIDLNKVGREGEGGDLIVGGKELDSDATTFDQGKGITVFNVDVIGDKTKLSNLGKLDSTNGDLETINIKTHADSLGNATFASLTIRDGFGNAGKNDVRGQANADNDLKAVNANEFKGDLSLGEDTAVLNLDTLNATGGGKVYFNARLDGAEEDQAYSYTTGANEDTVKVSISGDATDYAKSSVNVLTGAGKDEVTITTDMVDPQGNQILNQVVLKNIAVDTGADDDTVTLAATSVGDIAINTGAGNDTIYTSDRAGTATWAFNYDDARTGATTLGGTNIDNLPGVQTSLAFLNGATVRVTLSGAGIAAAANGGGVMAFDDAEAFVDGYEAQTTINTLINGNKYFGDQRDINAAIVKIIKEDATLNKLLTATVQADNTLVVKSLTSGAFDASDLEITLTQATAKTTSTPAFAASVLAEAETVFKNSSLTMTDLWGSDTPAEGATYVGADNAAGAIDFNNGQAGLHAYYTGLGVNNATQHTAGVASAQETDNTINAGAGNDVIVLSTDAAANPVPAFTAGINNRLLNGASNETIKLVDVFGNDVVMNFTSDVTQAGVDFLDFTSYLTSKESLSGSTASTRVKDITLAADAALVAANEVSIVRFDNTDVTDKEDFSGLTASVVANLFNLDGTTTALGTNNVFGNLSAADFSVLTNYDDENTVTAKNDLLSGAAKSVVMVENADNLGMYKVFELSWYAGTTVGDSLHTVAVTDLGSLDFGTTLDGLTAAALSSSSANKALVVATTGTVTPPVGGTFTDVAVTATGVTGAAAAEAFKVDVAAALADVAGTNFQTKITGFDVTKDKLVLDLPTADATITTLAQLATVTQGVNASVDPFAGEAVVTLGNDANGNEVATLTLVGLSDLAAVKVEIV